MKIFGALVVGRASVLLVLTVAAAAVLLASCATAPKQAVSPSAPAPVADKGFFLWLDEKLPDSESHRVRMMVNNRYLRMDDGQANSDYVLFDRAEGVIYSVVHGDHSIQVMGGSKNTLTPLPAAPRWDETAEPSHVLMRSDTPNAVTAQHYTYSLNGAECYHVVTVEGLLPEVLAAWRAYKKTLAGALAQTYDPAIDGADGCRSAAEILASQELIEHGFPLREWSTYGYSRFVQDYRWDVKLEPKLFELPADYHRFQFGSAP